MFLLKDEIIDSRFSHIQQIIILALAILLLCLLFYCTFYEEFLIVVYNPTNEVKEPSDYVGFLLGLANIYVIGQTAFRLFKRLFQMQKSN